ncbi:hypothetical protein NKDENANG_02706 [Candidatus Entotheonellaceae bacterium PAL068K]
MDNLHHGRALIAVDDRHMIGMPIPSRPSGQTIARLRAGRAKYGYAGRQIASGNGISPVSRPYRDHPHLHVTVSRFSRFEILPQLRPI